MSKAFTSSDSNAPQQSLGVLPTGRRPITAAGMVKVRQELRQLLDVTRPALLGAVADNDAEARGRLHTVEWRIQVLTRQIGLSDVVPEQADPPDLVALGTCVRVRDEDGSEHNYVIVGPDEIDAQRSIISHASPIGRALLGLSVGAWASIQRPAGVREVEVLSIKQA